MANLQPNAASASNLYNAFFDDPTLSDLTIRLSDRSVRVHRIVLCRQSEYFTKLLTGQFQERGCNEIELKEDDPASMVSLLRFIYDLPYDEGFRDIRLKPYAMAYVVANKYQVKGLQLHASNKKKRIVDSEMDLDSLDNHDPEASIYGFLNALRVIVTNTTIHDKLARKVMIEASTLNLQFVHQRPALVSLLRESADLGAEIIGHRDLEYGLSGGWVCSVDCEDKCTTLCRSCDVPFGKEFAWENRDAPVWKCGSCQHYDYPMCAECKEPVQWRCRGLQ